MKKNGNGHLVEKKVEASVKPMLTEKKIGDLVNAIAAVMGSEGVPGVVLVNVLGVINQYEGE